MAEPLAERGHPGWWGAGDALPVPGLSPAELHHQHTAPLPASWPPATGPQWAAAAAAPPPHRVVITTAPSISALPQPSTSRHGDNAGALSKARRCSKPKSIGRGASNKAAAVAAAAAADSHSDDAAGSGLTAPRRSLTQHVSRQQRRLAQRAQREVDQQRIKDLEHQLGALRVHLQSLTIQNKQLKQRQAALNATLEMQQQIRAAAAAAGGSAAGSGSAAPSARSEDDAQDLCCGGSESEEEEAQSEGAQEEEEEEEDAFSRLLELAAMSGREATPSVGTQQPTPSGSAVEAAEAGDSACSGGRPSASAWFHAASLHQHVQWYQQQVERLGELLSVLDVIPARLGRSLQDYQRHEDTLDGIQTVLACIDDWTIHMAALRPEDYSIVLHYNLAEVLAGRGVELPASPAVEEPFEPEAAIWQEMVEKLQLSPQQEQVLEAHQALFEQRAETLAGSKAAALAALADAAAKQDDQTLLEGAEALKASLQKDFSLKAPVMISLRKLLTPMQMARLTVDCWPYYTTMKNLSRAHKQRRQGRR